MNWQPIETAPDNEPIDVWLEADDGVGWRYPDLQLMEREPFVFMDEDLLRWYPHENGCWPTHWMPRPAPPK